jgi:AraC family transcriptional regulator
MSQANTAPSSILSAVVPGPASLLSTSTPLGWGEFLIERHISIPGIRAGGSIPRNVITMICSQKARGEYRGLGGNFVPYLKTRGALSVLPFGPVPELRLFDKTEIAYFAPENSFIEELLAEWKGPAPSPLRRQCGVQNPQLFEMFRVLLSESEAGGPNGLLFAESIAAAMTIHILNLQSSNGGHPLTAKPDTHPRRLIRIKEQIESGLANNLSLSELARESGYSRSHFAKWFHASTGMTPHRYVMEERLLRAQRQLTQTKLSLIDIAASCGFSSQAHMTSLFRKRFGLPPAEYRRRLL